MADIRFNPKAIRLAAIHGEHTDVGRAMSESQVNLVVAAKPRADAGVQIVRLTDVERRPIGRGIDFAEYVDAGNIVGERRPKRVHLELIHGAAGADASSCEDSRHVSNTPFVGCELDGD